MSEWSGWELTCGGELVDEFDEINEAMDVGDEHIRRACPRALRLDGPIEWRVDELTGVWSAAVGRTWLNHDIAPRRGAL